MKSSFRLGWEEWQAALRERERVQVQQLEAQFKAMRLAEQAAELNKYIEQVLAREILADCEEFFAATREEVRVKVQLFEAQFEARRLAEQAAENEKYIKHFLAGKTSKSNHCESHRERESNESERQIESQSCQTDKQIDRSSERRRERESNEFDRQTESQLCQTDKQTVRCSEPASEKDNGNRQTIEHTEKCDSERDRHTHETSMCTNNNNDLFIGAAAKLMHQQTDEPEDNCAQSRGGEGVDNAQIQMGGTSLNSNPPFRYRVHKTKQSHRVRVENQNIFGGRKKGEKVLAKAANSGVQIQRLHTAENNRVVIQIVFFVPGMVSRQSDGQGLLEVHRRQWISGGVKHRWRHRELYRTGGGCSSPSCHGGMLQRTKRGCWSGMIRSRCGTSASHHGGMLQVWVMTDPDKRPFFISSRMLVVTTVQE